MYPDKYALIIANAFRKYKVFRHALLLFSQKNLHNHRDIVNRLLTMYSAVDKSKLFPENGRVYLQRMADLVCYFLLDNQNSRLYNTLLQDVIGILRDSYVPVSRVYSLLVDNSRFSA